MQAGKARHALEGGFAMQWLRYRNAGRIGTGEKRSNMKNMLNRRRQGGVKEWSL